MGGMAHAPRNCDGIGDAASAVLPVLSIARGSFVPGFRLAVWCPFGTGPHIPLTRTDGYRLAHDRLTLNGSNDVTLGCCVTAGKGGS